jgi:pimeloyl-ACP methyl ester carboxylesterase
MSALAIAIIAGFGGAAQATSGFVPAMASERFEGQETGTTVDGTEVKLWNAIERWSDPDRTLFRQESFNAGTAWTDSEYSPWIATCFGTPTPPSALFLLHVGLHEETAVGTPILFVGGAGDNASRGFVTAATKLDRLNRPVYAITFAHPHGDVFQQAEVVADAIAVVKARTGADQVDVVAHSKGGIAATVYASNLPGTDWGQPAYEDVGTPYAGDIRRLVLMATPLGGIDTSFRWSSTNLYSLDAEEAISASAWDRYYPASTAVPLNFDSMADQDLLPDGADLFPGQRQLLARQDHPLPGSQSWLGAYALQTDWYTTYEGGTGFSSRSPGIDAAVEAGGGLIERLRTTGVDPDIAVYLLAGSNPLMPNGDDALAEQFAQIGRVTDYRDLLEKMAAHGTPVTADDDEIAGLDSGWLVLGEATGPSDGLVFVESATNVSAVDARGAVVAEVKVVNLSHLDLLYASPITGDLLVQAADDGDEEDSWMRGVGLRYSAEASLDWLQGVLADEAGPVDTGVPVVEDPDPPAAEPGEFERPCGGCSPRPGPALGVPALLGALLARRRRP